MDAAATRKLLGLVGLGVRGRLAVVGVEQVRDAAKKGTLALAVVAPDASRHSLDKVVPLLRAKKVLMIEGPDATALGHAVGRESAAAVGVVDWKLARGIRAIVDSAPERTRDAGDEASQRRQD
jgi:ribosomal protein L7Ae-like RNA K-turn-binding protein